MSMMFDMRNRILRWQARRERDLLRTQACIERQKKAIERSNARLELLAAQTSTAEKQLNEKQLKLESLCAARQELVDQEEGIAKARKQLGMT